MSTWSGLREIQYKAAAPTPPTDAGSADTVSIGELSSVPLSTADAVPGTTTTDAWRGLTARYHYSAAFLRIGLSDEGARGLAQESHGLPYYPKAVGAVGAPQSVLQPYESEANTNTLQWLVFAKVA